MNNFFELNNKLAIVTGSGRGIGKSLAFALANAGCDLILTARSKNELKEDFDIQHEMLPNPENTDKNFRSELIKTAVLVSIFIFSLIILTAKKHVKIG